jgi:hypothetical protein
LKVRPRDSDPSLIWAAVQTIAALIVIFAASRIFVLMAKTVSVAELWRFRGGQSQDLLVNLGKALHRLCPFWKSSGSEEPKYRGDVLRGAQEAIGKYIIVFGRALLARSRPHDGIVNCIKLALLLGSLGASRERSPSGVRN